MGALKCTTILACTVQKNACACYVCSLLRSEDNLLVFFIKNPAHPSVTEPLSCFSQNTGIHPRREWPHRTWRRPRSGRKNTDRGNVPRKMPTNSALLRWHCRNLFSHVTSSKQKINILFSRQESCVLYGQWGRSWRKICKVSSFSEAISFGGGFFFTCEDFWRMFDHLFRTCAFCVCVCVFFF